MPSKEAADSPNHFNNWPNEQGFDANYEQKTPVELPVTGEIPPYAAGVLYRTGPGQYKVDTEKGNTFQVSHWFDGFSQTHRFQLVAPESPSSGSGMRVFYNSRFSTDDMIEEAKETGSSDRFSFGGTRDPCKTMYQKVQTTYKPQNKAAYSNIGVTLSVNMPGFNGSSSSTDQGEDQAQADGHKPSIKSLYAKTDAARYKKLNPETLEPIGLAEQTDLHPDLAGPLSASHAKADPKTGDIYNYNLSFDPSPTYRVFRVSAATGETTILATFPGTPAYLHSFFLTEDYVILCIWNAHLSPERFKKSSYIGAIQPFNPETPAKWYVVDRRHNNGLIAIYNSPPFFCFHTINAWQESPSEADAELDPETERTNRTPKPIDIVAECITFENTSVLTKLYYESLISSSPSASAKPSPESRNNGGKTQSRITRFRLPSIPSPVNTTEPKPVLLQASIDWTSCASLAPELPTLNPAYCTVRHRYTYAVIDRGESTFFDGIVKFDSEAKETIVWSGHAQSPGEAIFVPDSQGANEDDGVLLSVVLDGISGRSYLLALDARTMREVGRASVGGPVAFGFHGQHVPVRGVGTGDF